MKHGILEIVLLIGIFNPTKGQIEIQHQVKCNEAYCKDNQIIEKCQSKRNCTTVGHRQFLFPGVCNCCGYCYDYLKENEPCQRQSRVIPNNMCGPRLECKPAIGNDDFEKCGIMTGSCGDAEKPCSCSYELSMYRQRQEDGTVGIADFQPDCDAHGKYKPRQCLPGSICLCMNEEGRPIFGMGLSNEIMNCACSRDMDRLKSYGILRDTPHCLANGDYDALQCNLRKRVCYCKLKPSVTVDIGKLDTLNCYDAKIHPINYIRPCEMARAEIDKLIYESEKDEYDILVGDFPRCDPDGFFGSIQSSGPNWICTDRHGNQIENFQFEKQSNNSLEPPEENNCLCARVREFLKDSATGKPKCCKDGNYRPWQCLGPKCFCVHPLTGLQDMTLDPPEVPIEEVSEDTLSCYKSGESC